jgi:mannose-6-phosphate isomerase-like protein (cupin superfamily)
VLELKSIKFEKTFEILIMLRVDNIAGVIVTMISSPLSDAGYISENIGLQNYQDILKNTKVDTKLNIKSSAIACDKYSSLNISELRPNQANIPYKSEHYSKLYQIVKGSGEVCLGELMIAGIRWSVPVALKAGDIFSVECDTYHQIKNTSSKESLVFITFSIFQR